MHVFGEMAIWGYGNLGRWVNTDLAWVKFRVSYKVSYSPSNSYISTCTSLEMSWPFLTRDLNLEEVTKTRRE